MDKIYEVVDASEDEIYYPLWLFTSLEQSVDKIKDSLPDTRRLGSGWNDCLEYEVIEVRERNLGVYEEHGKTVYKLRRCLRYTDDYESENWEVTGEEYL